MNSLNKSLDPVIKGIKSITRGDQFSEISAGEDRELEELVQSINQMAKAISRERMELQRQRDEFKILFAQVPCLITVQDKNFRLLNFNQEFANQFEPKPGEFCYSAYKGRDEKCVNCLVEKTFEDGKVHTGEETGLDKNGKMSHWILRTSPIRNPAGEIIATMEMSIDITEKRKLERRLEISEKKYQEIFDSIPNSVFVLDYETMEILDCNASVESVYGYKKEEIVNKSFLSLFLEEEREQYLKKIQNESLLTRVKHITRSGENIYVNIRLSLSGYPRRKILLVTTSDVTKRLETEHQLIQASKMATLGEMASAMAHELNQPLSVIKTACGFFTMKAEQKEKIDESTLLEVIEKMDRNIDRATRIINNMREFARKSGMDMGKVQVNEVIERSFEFFTQQMKLREIEIEWRLDRDIPRINADPGRLEQVFINLFLNARDAIEERWAGQTPMKGEKKITVRTSLEDETVICHVCDTGTGVPDKFKDKIFEPFFTTKEAEKGMGLGLSITYGIVKEFGGKIHVEANQPHGACFVMEFPVTLKKNKKDEI
ncbi:MAG: PAS domain S-box protein [Deltaproteobacteria bacterium]|nr:PAS domain S-box protein [Deltaproteobacteria bacterium]